MKRFVFFIMFVFLLSNLGFTQGRFVIQNKHQASKVKFKLRNNLIIVPVEINGVVLSFLLDTGVSKPIIFNFLKVSDTLNIKETETIFLQGLGDGESVKALRSKNNIIKIGDAIKLNQDLYAVYDSNLNFAPRLGVPIHGIIGFDLFRDLVVEINYSGKYLKLTNPKSYRYKTCRKCEILTLEFHNNKPYISAEVKVDEKNIPIKLLIDSGGSDSLWLFEDDSLGIKSKPAFFHDFLGYGLSGSVYGKRSVIDALSIKSFVLENINVAYPDDDSMLSAKQIKDRNGTLAGNILKRFNMIVDYQTAVITLKKNSYFKEEFSYNKSGIELAYDGVRLVKEDNEIFFNEKKSSLIRNSETLGGGVVVMDAQYKLSLKPVYSIVELREDSPAYNAGLMINDIVLSINGKSAHEFTLQQIIHMFYDDDGERIKLKVDRNGELLIFSFILETPLKQKP